jgi:hypothetical protein
MAQGIEGEKQCQEVEENTEKGRGDSFIPSNRINIFRRIEFRIFEENRDILL